MLDSTGEENVPWYQASMYLIFPLQDLFLFSFVMTFSFLSINNKRNAWWDNEMMRNTVLEFPDKAVVKVGVTDSNNSIKLLCMTF